MQQNLATSGAETLTPGIKTLAAASTQTPSTGTQTPATDTQAPTTETKTPAAEITPAQPLNCNYRIPAQTTRIEQTIVMKWAEKAAEQSFDFDYKTIDEQIAKLKACYTEQGWTGFNDALEKSGNLNAIRSQQLTVSPMVNGQAKITEIKDNQWKVTVPMQVVYQNDKEKLTQPLTIDLLVGRKVSGDLGIMQMIAIPHQNTQPTTPSPQ
ncbi:MAG: DotI/IcmL/TraM family protein [Tatlockia sp.]|nr:DotI/IcmL/TraM family protein [Tatlockia sp.]